MLFISRYIGEEHQGVVDTDDGDEQVSTINDIIEAVLVYNIPIFGITANDLIIRPYQPPETKTQLQLKTELLSFVKITVWNDIITNISWDSRKIKNPVSIRLSDFGLYLADFVFRGNDVSGDHKVTLIFDDKLLQVQPFSLQPLVAPRPVKGRDTVGVRFDLREVHDNALATSVYNSIMSSVQGQNRFGFVEIFESILDEQERKYKLLRMTYST